jgi:hypothetical protein
MSLRCRFVAVLAVLCVAAQPLAAQSQAPVAAAPPAAAGEYRQQFLVPGSHFHGVHGLAFNKDDQLFAGSVVGQAIYKVQVDSGEVDLVIPPPDGMADDIAFAPDGTMAWTAFLLGTVYTRRGDRITAVATGLPGINSLAFTKDGRLFASQVFLADALWEIDVRQVEEKDRRPPRKVMENIGGLNGFEFSQADGQLYGPLWFKGDIVKIDVDKGAVTTVARGFKVPAAVNFDSKGNLFVIDTALGQLWRVVPTSGERHLVATLKPGLDNLAIDSRDRVFVTNMVDNGIYLVDTTTGSSRTIVEGKLATPSDIAVTVENGREVVHIADIFAYRRVDGATGKVEDVLRMQGDVLEYPLGISAGAQHVLLTSWYTNSVQRIERGSGRSLGIWHGFKAPTDAIEMADGSILVLELGTGSLVMASGAEGKERRDIISGLAAPVAMARAGATSVYITELGNGTIIEVDLVTGQKRTLADGLKGPEGIDVGPDGRIYVAEVGERRVVAIDPKGGERQIIARNLAIGLGGYKDGPPAFVTTGVAVGPSGAVYVASDVRNALYKLTPPAN